MSLFALYRFFDTEDVLLYVGLTINPGKRFEKHRYTKSWWHEVDRIEIERFDDLQTLRAAERKAIQDEKPLFNIRMNPHRTPGDLVWLCDVCKEPVEDEEGWLTVSYAEIAAHEQQEAAARVVALERGGGHFAVYKLTEFPDTVQWSVYHRRCDPDLQGSDYWIAIERIRTLPQMVQWTAHLLEKNWIADTNWNSLLYRQAGHDA